MDDVCEGKDFSFPEQEERVLQLWANLDPFHEQLRRTEGGEEFAFYDGPPFATGLPQYGHILAGTIKDVVTRHQSMRGRHVSRRLGWDCHGLPVEFEIYYVLGITNRRQVFDLGTTNRQQVFEVFNLGIDKYNQTCRSIVTKHDSEWEAVVTHPGRWIDFKNGYNTMDLNFMESVWWVFAQLWEKDLIFKGFKVSYAVPDHDQAVMASFSIIGDMDNSSVLAWTTTPWTLLSNLGLCVNANLTYAKVKDKSNGAVYVIAESRLGQLPVKAKASGKKGTPSKGSNAEAVQDGLNKESYELVAKIPVSSLVGLKFFMVEKIKYHSLECDKETCWVPDFACSFFMVEKIKYQSLECDKETCWVPDFAKGKRFDNWIEDTRDWAVIRSKSCCTPLPLWMSQACEETFIMDSIEKLEKLSELKVTDLHRDYIDDITIPSKRRPEFRVLKRVDVFDCWFGSGSMPYAYICYLFENRELFKKDFPGNFVAEGLDQTPGWFYTLMVLSTALFGKPAFKNLICNGLVLAEDGKKMSKSKNNYPSPKDLIGKYGKYGVDSLQNSPVVHAESLRLKSSGLSDVVVPYLVKHIDFLTTYLRLNHKRFKGRTGDEDWRVSLSALYHKRGIEKLPFQLPHSGVGKKGQACAKQGWKKLKQKQRKRMEMKIGNIVAACKKEGWKKLKQQQRERMEMKMGNIVAFFVKVEGTSIPVQYNLSITTTKMCVEHACLKKGIKNYDCFAVHQGKILCDSKLLSHYKLYGDCTVEVRARGRAGREIRIKYTTFDDELDSVGDLFSNISLPKTLKNSVTQEDVAMFLSAGSQHYARQALIALCRVHFRKKCFNGLFNSSHILFHEGWAVFDNRCVEEEFTEDGCREDLLVFAKIFRTRFLSGKISLLYVNDLVDYLSTCPFGVNSNSIEAIALLVNHPALISFVERMTQCSTLDAMVKRLTADEMADFIVAVGTDFKWGATAWLVTAMVDILKFDPHRKGQDADSETAEGNDANSEAIEDERVTLYTEDPRSCLKFATNYFKHARKQLFLVKVEAAFSLNLEPFLPMILRNIVLNFKGPPSFDMIVLLGDHLADNKRKKDTEDTGKLAEEVASPAKKPRISISLKKNERFKSTGFQFGSQSGGSLSGA